ncbi:MAG: hypothetical protein A3J38_05120 [Gammaproteobacteria bacterium RIFCSPHIGHO2_12_FULL_45_9]|nr:MAG: hypothetical protein A3J38_05120 [Gammaproteobacteria bacterium RIFCSPHIGHO2_12_FULL_45_9]
MKSLLTFKQQKGLSLIEVLLALTVSAMVIVMSTRYFWTANQAANITQATSQIQRITNASYQWLDANRQSDFADITLTALVSANLISANDQTNPWGGTITASVGQSDPTHVRITLASVPQTQCQALVRALATTAYTEISTCTADNTTYWGEF